MQRAERILREVQRVGGTISSELKALAEQLDVLDSRDRKHNTNRDAWANVYAELRYDLSTARGHVLALRDRAKLVRERRAERAKPLRCESYRTVSQEQRVQCDKVMGHEHHEHEHRGTGFNPRIESAWWTERETHVVWAPRDHE